MLQLSTKKNSLKSDTEREKCAYYEQVALLHLPNRLASDETEEFCPNMFDMSRRTI